MKRKHKPRGDQAQLQGTRGVSSKSRVLTTRELLRRARRRRAMIEAYLLLNGGLRATHWFTYLGKGVYLAEGIDGEAYRTTAREFAKAYAWVGALPVWHVS